MVNVAAYGHRLCEHCTRSSLCQSRRVAMSEQNPVPYKGRASRPVLTSPRTIVHIFRLGDMSVFKSIQSLESLRKET